MPKDISASLQQLRKDEENSKSMANDIDQPKYHSVIDDMIGGGPLNMASVDSRQESDISAIIINNQTSDGKSGSRGAKLQKKLQQKKL